VKRRLARARDRDRSYGHLKTEEDSTSLSFLEHNAVKKETAKSYNARLEESISHLYVVIMDYFEDPFRQADSYVRRGQKDSRSVKEMEKMGAVALRAATLIEGQPPLLLQGLQQPHLPIGLRSTKRWRMVPSRGFPATPGPQHA
jgi:hypothetical protein